MCGKERNKKCDKRSKRIEPTKIYSRREVLRCARHAKTPRNKFELKSTLWWRSKLPPPPSPFHKLKIYSLVDREWSGDGPLLQFGFLIN